MSTTHIKPTVGRIVWYRGADGEVRPAIVTGVNGDFNVNLYVFPIATSDTDCCLKGSVTHADPEQEPGCKPSWHWMPYQVEQAKKADGERQLAEAAGRESDEKRWRAGLLDMALRTPGISGHRSALDAAVAYQKHIEGVLAPTDAEIVEAFRYQLSIDGGDAEMAAINTVRVLRGEA